MNSTTSSRFTTGMNSTAIEARRAARCSLSKSVRGSLGISTGAVCGDHAVPSHQRTSPGVHGSGYQPGFTREVSPTNAGRASRHGVACALMATELETARSGTSSWRVALGALLVLVVVAGVGYLAGRHQGEQTGRTHVVTGRTYVGLNE